MEWVNNVITVQALPQDRHISWPTHPFSLSAIQPLLHPVFCPPIFIPLATGHPSLSAVCVRRSPGYTLVVCQDTSLFTHDRFHRCIRDALICTCEPAMCRSSINSLVQHTDETSRRIARVWENDGYLSFPRIVLFAMSLFSYFTFFTSCCFFPREILLFLSRFLLHAMAITVAPSRRMDGEPVVHDIEIFDKRLANHMREGGG